ncbi:MAG: head-tail connector protein [Mycobacterium sp.]
MYGIAITARTGSLDPVTSTEIKAHVRQDHTADDTVLADLVSAAALKVEDDMGTVLREATLTLTMDRWPTSGVIAIPRFPVQSVGSVTYLEEGEVSATTLSSTLYRVDTTSLPPRLVLKKNQQWPTDALEHGAPITVTFTAGYADGAVPEREKHAVKLLVGHWYANRESVVTGTIAQNVPESYRSLVLGSRLW